MSAHASRPADTYVPTYFLSSVGAGGLAVTFFMYLMFWVPHPGKPVPVFEDISAAFATGTPALQGAIIVAALGIAVFAFMNIKGLIWNLGQLSQFAKTERYTALRNSNAESTLLAAPLAVAMSINASFIVGLVFVPQLWSIVEYLFPAALVAFALTGIWALSLIGSFLGRVLSKGGVFDVTAHNSFAQMLPAFALAMVAVGLSAPAAMSGNTATVGTALVLSTLFGVAATIYAAVAVFTAFNSMLHYGTAKEAGPTLLIIVPLMTVLGIMLVRQNHGLHTTFEVHTTAGETMVLLARLLAVQLAFLGLGLAVLRRQGYFKEFVMGPKTSAGSYALVCPGVALSVMLHFFINKGLVAAGVIAKYDVTYWGLTAIALIAQFAMVALVFRLNRQHFSRHAPAAVPAE
ncbi:TsoY family (seleno)protein [Donghicola tyrosinivorans]|uniref:Voltage-gated anion channel n=1 Tax=Donghicola tyrosinivorans TaxID=1652492 RepID=A0A2T0WM75_9RHOB|nr:hypothetical protein [Donghicola tyrosinivorans]PRY87785.1 hypothetical protein CLV74_109107 [Donghicola tyrosinivorans]